MLNVKSLGLGNSSNYMGDCWLLLSIQGLTQVRFDCLSPQEDTFMDTLNMHNSSRTFCLYFTKVFPPADAGFGGLQSTWQGTASTSL